MLWFLSDTEKFCSAVCVVVCFTVSVIYTKKKMYPMSRTNNATGLYLLLFSTATLSAVSLGCVHYFFLEEKTPFWEVCKDNLIPILPCSLAAFIPIWLLNRERASKAEPSAKVKYAIKTLFTTLLFALIFAEAVYYHWIDKLRSFVPSPWEYKQITRTEYSDLAREQFLYLLITTGVVILVCALFSAFIRIREDTSWHGNSDYHLKAALLGTLGIVTVWGLVLFFSYFLTVAQMTGLYS